MKRRIYTEGYDIYFWQNNHTLDFHELLDHDGTYEDAISCEGDNVTELVKDACKMIKFNGGLTDLSKYIVDDGKTLIFKIIKDANGLIYKEADTEPDYIYNLFVYEFNLEEFNEMTFTS